MFFYFQLTNEPHMSHGMVNFDYKVRYFNFDTNTIGIVVFLILWKMKQQGRNISNAKIYDVAILRNMCPVIVWKEQEGGTISNAKFS